MLYLFLFILNSVKKYSGNKITTTTTGTTTTTTTTTTITTTITAHFRLWWVRDLAPKVVIATG